MEAVCFLMHSFFIQFLPSMAIWWLASSFMEWALHRYVMHRPVGAFDYPFKAHAVIHHQVFKADHTYHLIRQEDKRTIPMAWWNGPVLIVLASIPVMPVAYMIGSWWVYFGAMTGTAVYYSVYEYIHWCMHLPKERRMERSWAFRRLNGHHLLHHRYMHKNFNVVFPMADLLLGTLVIRSKTRFAQPQSPAVPDVQPLSGDVLGSEPAHS
jgi:Fatty acid hydroxylase superfamily